MDQYPEVLISHSSYPELHEQEVSNSFFIRRTDDDIYHYLNKYTRLELIEKIIPRTPKRDVFVLSVSLYGYYDCSHLNIIPVDPHFNQNWDRSLPDAKPEEVEYSRKNDAYPLFLNASKVFNYSFKYNKEQFFLSFWHQPTIVNYWHFQLFTSDSEGNHLPRNPKFDEKETKEQERKLKRIAIVVFEYLLSEAICYFSEVQKFQNSEFDKIILSFPIL
ncbi:hypothetical protein AGMMS50293_05120 [Spirochaetia bacterium]|nr:hypothetical protein AGMMS50293_05120 [Spirochaetia bacterium]